MKILISYHAMGEHGGAARMYAARANKWAEKHDVTILSHYGTGSMYKLDKKVKNLSGITSAIPGKLMRSLLSPLMFAKLVFTLIKEKPDALIINNGPYYGQFFGTIAGKLTGTPVAVWKNAGYHMESSIMYKMSRQICFRLVDALVVLTEGDKKHALEFNKKVFVIKYPHSGLKPNDNKADKHIALCVGRIVKQKSLEHLITAWKKAVPHINGWKLYIVGDGDLKPEMENLASETKSIVFTGASNEVDKYYSEASFFVMSSMHEGLPTVLVEAMAHKLPLISYDCPYGPSAAIENDKNGLLVENGSIDKLAEAIIKMANSDEMRRRHSEYAPVKLKEFSMDVIEPIWENVLNSIIKTKKR